MDLETFLRFMWNAILTLSTSRRDKLYNSLRAPYVVRSAPNLH